MPVYEYRCDDCNNQFEQTQRMSDDPLKVCPKCQGSVYRIISKNIGIAFKGAGFYANDSQTAAKSPAPSEKLKSLIELIFCTLMPAMFIFSTFETRKSQLNKLVNCLI